VGQDAEAVGPIVAAVREAVALPIVAKLTAEGGRIGLVARRAFEAGPMPLRARPTAWASRSSTSTSR
jgi:dihydroorotate dehydrogenase